MSIIASSDGDGKRRLLVVLEPGNFAKMEMGDPFIVRVAKFLPELADLEIHLCYTPDAAWIAEQIRASPEKGEVDLPALVQESLSRKKVFLRDTHNPEELVNTRDLEAR